MAYFNPFVYFIKSFIRLFTRKFFWVLLIFILMFLGFIVFSNTSNAYIPDDSNIEDLMLEIFTTNTNITLSSLNTSNQYIYCCCYDSVADEYWLFGGLCRESDLNNIVFGSVDNTTNYNIRMNMGNFTPSLWLLQLDGNLSVLNSYHKTDKLTGTKTINAFISSYFGVNTSVFRYCNLLFVNNSQLSKFRTYYTSFVPRARCSISGYSNI